jgi:hypothetical protein
MLSGEITVVDVPIAMAFRQIVALMAVGTALVSCADSRPMSNAPQTRQVSYEPLAQ